MPHLPGARVAAVLSADEQEVRLCGVGVYFGLDTPPTDVGGWIGDAHRAAGDTTWTNPRIDLDNGQTVWGCECWWMPEEKLAAFVGSRRVVTALPHRTS